MSTAITYIEDTAQRVPIYCRVIALRMAQLWMSFLSSDNHSPNTDQLRTLFAAAVRDEFASRFGLPPEEASSEAEFIDFYVRHGIVTNNLALHLFKSFVEAANESYENQAARTDQVLRALQMDLSSSMLIR